jgi:Nucleotidyl transferase of unknown function (DUF2204)
MAHEELDPETRRFYRDVLSRLSDAGVPFLVGGAYAFERYTGIARDTKDLDLFVRRQHRDRAMEALQAAGYRADCTFPHWLAKAFHADTFVDLIWSSGNGVARVDDAWFAHAIDERVLDVPVRLCPVEEMIWSKAFIMERERFDGGDIAHLIRARGSQLAWRRLVRRFDGHWRVLLSHLILFGFIYPNERAAVPAWVLSLLVRRLSREPPVRDHEHPVCFGTLLSRSQYLVDIEHWGYRDGRRPPMGTMSARDISRWTAAIEDEPAAARVEPRPSTGD